jgi:hypothetical protein
VAPLGTRQPIHSAGLPRRRPVESASEQGRRTAPRAFVQASGGTLPAPCHSGRGRGLSPAERAEVARHIPSSGLKTGAFTKKKVP